MKIPKDFAWSFSPQIQAVRDFMKDDWLLPTEGVDQNYAAREILSVRGLGKRIASAAAVLVVAVFMIAGLVAMHK